MTTTQRAVEDCDMDGPVSTVPMHVFPQSSSVPRETATDDEDPLEVCALLERASLRLDQMWNESRGMRDSRLWMQLGEASHSLHRTLIVLRERR